MSSLRRRSPSHAPRRGQALFEFAIIAFVLSMILGGMLAIGLLLFGANVIQQAADVGAQELARLPLPPAIQFMDHNDGSFGDYAVLQTALTHTDVKSQIFHERYLVVDLNNDLTSGQTIDDFFADKPLINRLLRSVMIVEDADLGSGTTRVLRYPGTLVRHDGSGLFTVLIPVIGARDPATGVETITEWRHVVEEVDDDGNPATVGPFSVASTATNRGMVALRINFPYQSAALVAVQYQDAGGNVVDPVTALGSDLKYKPVQASDSGVADTSSTYPFPSGYSLVIGAGQGTGAYSGQYGLGRSFAYVSEVRPYRKLVAAQGIYRREVFE